MLKGEAKSRNIDGVLPTLWAHRSSYAGDEIWSGKKIVDYNILNTYAVYDSIIADKAGVIVHEFLHTLDFQIYTLIKKEHIVLSQNGILWQFVHHIHNIH